jgi:uncharacterized protein
MIMIQRELLAELKKWMDRKEILAIKGPRQSGKTTILKLLADWLVRERGLDEKHIISVTFEDREQLDAFSQNPKEFVRRRLAGAVGRTVLLIDEAQYAPELGQKLKLLYDLFPDVKMVVTGSSSLELKNQTGRFLVGRMFEFELMPLSFSEFLGHRDPGLAEMFGEWHAGIALMLQGKGSVGPKTEKEIFAGELLSHLNEYVRFGGFPAVATAAGDEEKRVVLKNLIGTYIDRDVVSFLQVTDTIKFRRLMTGLAASNGSILRIEPLASEVGSHFRELTKLLDVLEQTYVIRRVGPYHKNLLTELKKAQKFYFVDPGLRNALIDDFNAVDKRADAGAIMENFVLNELSRYTRLSFWRTTSKAEVDFVSSVPGGMIPIEVKFRRFPEPKVGRSLYSFLDQYSPDTSIIMTKDFWGEKMVGRTRVLFMPLCYA